MEDKLVMISVMLLFLQRIRAIVHEMILWVGFHAVLDEANVRVMTSAWIDEVIYEVVNCILDLEKNKDSFKSA